MLQCVAACCSEFKVLLLLQHVAVCAVCCSVLQRLVVCCSVLQQVASPIPVVHVKRCLGVGNGGEERVCVCVCVSV